MESNIQHFTISRVNKKARGRKEKARRQHTISVASEIPTRQMRSALARCSHFSSWISRRRMQVEREWIMVKVTIRKSNLITITVNHDNKNNKEVEFERGNGRRERSWKMRKQDRRTKVIITWLNPDTGYSLQR